MSQRFQRSQSTVHGLQHAARGTQGRHTAGRNEGAAAAQGCEPAEPAGAFSVVNLTQKNSCCRDLSSPMRTQAGFGRVCSVTALAFFLRDMSTDDTGYDCTPIFFDCGDANLARVSEHGGSAATDRGRNGESHVPPSVRHLCLRASLLFAPTLLMLRFYSDGAIIGADSALYARVYIHNVYIHLHMLCRQCRRDLCPCWSTRLRQC